MYCESAIVREMPNPTFVFSKRKFAHSKPDWALNMYTYWVYICIWRLCSCLKNCLVVMRIPSSFECLVGILMLTPPQSKKETLSKQGKPHFFDGANSMLWRWRGLDDQLLASSSCVRESRILVRRLSSSSISTNPSTKKKKQFRMLVQFAWCCSTWTDSLRALITRHLTFQKLIAGHFSQTSTVIGSAFAENDRQWPNEISFASWPSSWSL